ncbi:uncharacterized protein LOC143284596 [Babylonia areolata]|uniref:uncharacterized protein LOC143284596 n=1 Tax=Babylonia areolata TaxID=304850 RepID=UPI003FD69BB8
MQAHILAVVCFYFYLAVLISSQQHYEDKLPDGCKVYGNSDCDRRYRELNRVTDNSTSWAPCVKQLHVQPVGTVTPHASFVSLVLSWTLPECRTGRTPVKGLKVTVTALDDGSQHAVCHVLDLSAVPWPFTNTSQCTMTYGFPLPALRTNYNWNVRVESVPGYNATSTMVQTDTVVTDSLVKTSCGVVSVTYMTRPRSVTVTVCGDVSTRHQAYDVNLYQCSDCCKWFCQMPRVEQQNVIFPNTTVEFVDHKAGSYYVIVRLADSVDGMCAAIGVLHFTHMSSSTPTPIVTTTDSTTAPVTSHVTSHITSHVTSPVTDTDEVTGPPPDGGNNDSSDKKTTVMMAVTVCVILVVLVVLVVAVVLLIHRHRHTGQTAHSSLKDLSCMEKLTARTSCLSADSDAGPSVQDPCGTVSVLPARAPHSPVTVFLLSHATLQTDVHVSDCLAGFLQAFCACDVIYPRWHSRDIVTQGPQAWAAQHLVTADSVLFLHSPETQDCYEAWKLGLLKANDNDVEVRILSTVFDHVFGGKLASRKWFDVTFHSEFCKAADGVWSSVLADVDWHRCGSISNVEGRANDSGKGGTNNTSFAETDMTHQSTSKSTDSRPSTGRFYLLMNDLSQLLADLHNVPNLPAVFRDHRLPLDADHLDSHEGRQLYRAVAILHGDSLGCSDTHRSANTQHTADTGDGYPGVTGVQRVDSGYEDMSLSFIAPEELSVVDSEGVSLSERFHVLNVRYEMAVTGEQLAYRSECYSLGSRYV